MKIKNKCLGQNKKGAKAPNRLLTKWYFRKQISKIPFFINVKSIYTTKKSKKQHIHMLSLLSI